MKKLILVIASICLLASCGSSKLPLDGNYSGAFFGFAHPAEWKIIPSDVQVVIESDSNSASFKFLMLESAKKNSIDSISDMTKSYESKISSAGPSVEKTVIKISDNETVWFDSTEKNLRSVAFFMPVDGGVFSGMMENIADSSFAETIIDVFKSFFPKSIPQVAKPDETAEFITHNGVIYSIAFPKTWKVSGDNPMVIKSDERGLEVSVETNDKATPDNLGIVTTDKSTESFLGQSKTMVTWSDDKTSATYRLPLHGKIMSIRASGFKDGIDAILEKCLKSFKYFPEKDLVATQKGSDGKNPEPKNEHKPIKPAEDIKVKPEETATKGETFEGDLFRFNYPEDWKTNSLTNMVTEIRPPETNCKTYIQIMTQPNSESAMAVAKNIVDAVAPGTQINEVKVGKLIGAQFTYDLGQGPTVTTILAYGKNLITINYIHGDVDFKKVYAQILGSFEAK